MTPKCCALSKTKSTVKAGLLEYCWTSSQIYPKRSDKRTLFRPNPQEVTFEEPMTIGDGRNTVSRVL